MVDGLTSAGLIQRDERENYVTLSLEGWRRFEELRRGTPAGRQAFMAMEYQNATLDKIVDEYFRPAVAATGFVLKRLDDEPKAGLIDDRLRAEIHTSRFPIVDLTHKNAGAYWEAGCAEGLGEPVIYTCEASKFEAASHFDTNHHLHVFWNENDLSTAAKQLKATIRATIPEAKPQD